MRPKTTPVVVSRLASQMCFISSLHARKPPSVNVLLMAFRPPGAIGVTFMDLLLEFALRHSSQREVLNRCSSHTFHPRSALIPTGRQAGRHTLDLTFASGHTSSSFIQVLI